MEENSSANWIIVGVGALIILVGGWWVITHNKSGAAGSTASSTATGAATLGDAVLSPSGGVMTGSAAQNTSTTMATEVANGDAVSVVDQPAGGSTAVASVALSKPGWVAVRDERGWTLGAGWFDAGTQKNVSVPLLRATESGKKYQALLYIDTAGDHTFDVHGETLVTNADGSIAGSMFTAQ